MKDPALDYLSTLSLDGASDNQAPEIVERLFSEGKVFSRELNSLKLLKTDVISYLEEITSHGVEAATLRAISS